MILVKPSHEHLASYIAALRRECGLPLPELEVAKRALETAQDAPDRLLTTCDDPEAHGPPIRMDDGSFVPRLPGIERWIWDGEFCGSINLRWQVGTPTLPPTCLGHIGYSVVPWKRRRGYATAALAQILPLARERGLPFVEITTNLDNVASQKVILANGGAHIEEFQKLPVHGGGPALRFRIYL